MSSVIPAIQYVTYRPRVLGVFDKYVCMTQVQGQRKFAAEYTVVAVVHMIYLWVNIHLATPYTGKTPCKYGPIFIPYIVQSCKYGAKTGPYLHSVFPVLYIYIHIYIYTYIHTYIHTHTHTDIHT